MLIYFMRHGQTYYNLMGLCNDDPADRVFLTDNGVHQAEQAALSLHATPLDIIISSELPRTIQTAEIINKQHQVPVMTHAALNDIRTGFNNEPVSAYMEAVSPDPLHIAFDDGESLLEHKYRVLNFLEWIAPLKYNTVLVIAHEETLRVFYALKHNMPDTELRQLHFSNCEYFEFEL